MTEPAPVALVTGGARRIGAAICKELHRSGWRVIIHYQHSESDAKMLAERLNRLRPESAACLSADLAQADAVRNLARAALQFQGTIDALVNNASAFYPTPIGESTDADWDTLMASNLRAPYFLSQALAPALRETGGAILNLVDIHAGRPMRGHSLYSIAKAGLQMMTASLALELAPEVRVNGIAPGAILWPEQDRPDAQQRILERIPLGRIGEPADIARTACFLLNEAPYITGQVIAVDGGRSLNL